MSSSVLLSVRNLQKAFGSQRVIRDLSFDLARGERLALFAPSGAGKTTLIRILAGLETADGGTCIFRAERPVTVFQEPRLFPHLTVEENIRLPFTATGQKFTAELNDRLMNWLIVCELERAAGQYPCQLSGGMKQKVAIIRTMLARPSFVLMDEPFQSIGMESKQEIIQYMLADCPNLTLLFITHIREEVQLLAQQVLYFEGTSLRNPILVPAESFGSPIYSPVAYPVSFGPNLFFNPESEKTITLNPSVHPIITKGD